MMKIERNNNQPSTMCWELTFIFSSISKTLVYSCWMLILDCKIRGQLLLRAPQIVLLLFWGVHHDPRSDGLRLKHEHNTKPMALAGWFCEKNDYEKLIQDEHLNFSIWSFLAFHSNPLYFLHRWFTSHLEEFLKNQTLAVCEKNTMNSGEFWCGRIAAERDLAKGSRL